MNDQHNNPCKECPFGRPDPNQPKKSLGGSVPEVYVGQIYGPFFLPCHMRHDSSVLAERLNNDNPQCAGAAIVRSNIGVAEMIPGELLHLPEDKEKAFTDVYEFYAYYKGISVEEAKKILTSETVFYFVQAQFAIAKLKAQFKQATIKPAKKGTT